MFEVNVFGLMRVTRAVLPVMRRQRSGHIFNIASGAGYSAGPVPYHTSKFAVTGFSTALAFEVAPFGIHVTNVAPGLFRTGFYDKGKWRTEPDLHIPDYDPFRWQTEFVREARCHQQPGIPSNWPGCLWKLPVFLSRRCICLQAKMPRRCWTAGAPPYRRIPMPGAPELQKLPLTENPMPSEYR